MLQAGPSQSRSHTLNSTANESAPKPLFGNTLRVSLCASRLCEGSCGHLTANFFCLDTLPAIDAKKFSRLVVYASAKPIFPNTLPAKSLLSIVCRPQMQCMRCKTLQAKTLAPRSTNILRTVHAWTSGSSSLLLYGHVVVN
jgi:hypothetical protein